MQRTMALLGIMVFAALAGNAQFKKGDRMTGPSVATLFYNSGSADIEVASIGSNKSVTKNYNISIIPQLGWFVSENTVIGATLNINPNGQKVSYEQNGATYQSDKSTAFNIGAGAFVRNFFGGAGKTMLPFVQLSINGGFSSLKTEGFYYGGAVPANYKLSYTGDSNGGNYINASFAAGLTKMLGQNAGLDFYLGYNYSHQGNKFKKTTLRDVGNDGSIEERGENETTTKFTNHGFSAGVGFQIYLRKKKN